MSNEILNNMVEVQLTRDDSFLIIKETLTRIGVPNNDNDTLYQTCHLLHKAGKYYITHFKLLFELDGKTSSIDKTDIQRQNTIATLIESWGLLKLIKPIAKEDMISMKMIKIVPSKEKSKWKLVAKHRIGSNQRKVYYIDLADMDKDKQLEYLDKVKESFNNKVNQTGNFVTIDGTDYSYEYIQKLVEKNSPGNSEIS